MDWTDMTPEEAQALAAGMQAAEDEVCTYCDGEGGEERGPDYYVPCPICLDGRK